MTQRIRNSVVLAHHHANGSFPAGYKGRHTSNMEKFAAHKSQNSRMASWLYWGVIALNMCALCINITSIYHRLHDDSIVEIGNLDFAEFSTLLVETIVPQAKQYDEALGANLYWAWGAAYQDKSQEFYLYTRDFFDGGMPRAQVYYQFTP